MKGWCFHKGREILATVPHAFFLHDIFIHGYLFICCLSTFFILMKERVFIRRNERTDRKAK
ncbi:MAG: hypothetical protein DRN21_00595 [Thermoplasmata archaeon]|nr:MAG: hypothetical protein DRN21_00595 [Thermoplasmata archaeon]